MTRSEPSPQPDPAQADSLSALLQAAEAARRSDDPAAGMAAARQARDLAGAAGRAADRARAGLLLTIHLWRLGDSAAALQAGLETLPEVDRDGAAADAVELRCTLVSIQHDMGRPADALPLAVQALEQARALGDPGLLSLAHNRLGVVYDGLGDLDRAVELMQEAVSLAESAADPERLLAARLNLAGARAVRAKDHHGVGDGEAMRADAAAAREQLALAEALASERPHARMFCAHIAFIAAWLLDDRAAMADTVQRHGALATQLGLAHFGRVNQLLQAQQALAEGRADEACALLQALELSDLQGNAAAQHWWLETRARALAAAGRWAEAWPAAQTLLQHERRERRHNAVSQVRVLLREMEVQLARAESERLREQARQARDQARRDPLTGLCNRLALDEELPALLAGGKRPQVLMLDLDYFKQVNDRHGHAAGDAVLRCLAALLHEALPDALCVARNGGEEFVVLIPGPLEVARQRAESLRLQVQQLDWPAPLGRGEVTISLGLADPQPGDDAAAVLRRADVALYEAKRAGRNRLRVARAEAA
jgi:diguanylate cyclase (GGDEF)-like protein